MTAESHPRATGKPFSPLLLPHQSTGHDRDPNSTHGHDRDPNKAHGHDRDPQPHQFQASFHTPYGGENNIASLGETLFPAFLLEALFFHLPQIFPSPIT